MIDTVDRIWFDGPMQTTLTVLSFASFLFVVYNLCVLLDALASQARARAAYWWESAQHEKIQAAKTNQEIIHDESDDDADKWKRG